MAPNRSTNFKTYEAQTRLLAAVIATTNVKLDFNALAKHAGSDCTPSSIDHRLRPIKQLAQLQRACLANGQDPADLPTEKAAIQKLFGESTPAGLEWQFRDIKKLGKAQQAAVAKGESPVNVMSDVMGKRGTGSAYSTPSGRTSKHAPAPTPGSRASTMTATPGGGASRKRKQTAALKYADLDSNEVSDDDSDYDSKDTELESTPSRKRNRLANAAAAAGSGGAVGENSSTPTKANSNNTTYVNDTNPYSTGNGGGTQLFSTARQSIEPASASASTTGFDSPRQARVDISPRKDIPLAHEVIDLSGGSPEQVDADSPMFNATHNRNLNTYSAPPPHDQPRQQPTKKPVVKPEFPLVVNSSQSTSTASFTSSHATSGNNSAAAFSFGGTCNDPFAGFDGYAHDGAHAYDHGRPASDDEC